MFASHGRVYSAVRLPVGGLFVQNLRLRRPVAIEACAGMEGASDRTKERAALALDHLQMFTVLSYAHKFSMNILLTNP